jgi:hypothetical protein
MIYSEPIMPKDTFSKGKEYIRNTESESIPNGNASQQDDSTPMDSTPSRAFQINQGVEKRTDIYIADTSLYLPIINKHAISLAKVYMKRETSLKSLNECSRMCNDGIIPPNMDRFLQKKARDIQNDEQRSNFIQLVMADHLSKLTMLVSDSDNTIDNYTEIFMKEVTNITESLHITCNEQDILDTFHNKLVTTLFAFRLKQNGHKAAKDAKDAKLALIKERQKIKVGELSITQLQAMIKKLSIKQKPQKSAASKNTKKGKGPSKPKAKGTGHNVGAEKTNPKTTKGEKAKKPKSKSGKKSTTTKASS